MPQILDSIKEKNPMHYKKLKKNSAWEDEMIVQRAEDFLHKYIQLLEKQGLNIEYAVDSYLHLCHDMMYEQIQFVETGKYRYTSFEEVNSRVYGNPDTMEYYMHGLLLSQYLWEHHYKILECFYKNINKFSAGVKNILEVGGGHGLYANEVFNAFNFDFDYTMVDISETSIEMAKNFLKDRDIKFIVEDVYKYETTEKFDLIIMGEVLEHVEDPLTLMKKLYSLGSDNVTAFITVPCNAPAIDHIYLFRNPGELIALYNEAGWEVVLDVAASSESKKSTAVDDPMIPIMHAAFLKKKKA
ncbi:MAG: class I SAM-dependent methyltransferase [Taibaiella sp.]|nr:class I SAM-dependent methyltransferase [Taibaiella sp.]